MNTLLPLVLASKSPRRKMLLKRLGIEYEVITADIPEEEQKGETPAEYTARLAREKALAVFSKQTGDIAVIGADTTVVLHGKIIGKPRDRQEAIEMLGELSGETHEVYTSVILFKRKGGVEREEGRTIVTKVGFRRLFTEEIITYVDTDEPYDKAGAYAVQGLAASFIDEISGSFTNVIGFPVKTVVEMLATAGVIQLE